MNYMFYLRSKISSQPSNPSHDTSPYRFMFKFEVKFANLGRRDPYRKNVNLNLQRFASAKLCRHLSRAVGLVGVWGWKGRRFVSSSACSYEP